MRSVAERERVVTEWLAAGKLAPLLKERTGFFKDEGDGAENFLTKYSESVVGFPDADGDGKADAVEVVADTFRDPMDGPGSALVALPDGRWLFGCPPNLWRLNDRNADHRAEERSPLAEGFGLSNAPWGADLHALLEAPDGWIYFGMGERGYEVMDGEGTRRRGMGSGAVFRCQADGSGADPRGQRPAQSHRPRHASGRTAPCPGPGCPWR